MLRIWMIWSKLTVKRWFRSASSVHFFSASATLCVAMSGCCHPCGQKVQAHPSFLWVPTWRKSRSMHWWQVLRVQSQKSLLCFDALFAATLCLFFYVPWVLAKIMAQSSCRFWKCNRKSGCRFSIIVCAIFLAD
jgi:hypothetical protein